MERLSEVELIKRIIDKDEKALLFVYKKYSRYIYNYIYKQLQNEEKAEELTQDVFMDFIESLPKFRYHSSIKTFLFSITRHKTIDVIKRKKIKNILFSRLPQHIVETLLIVLLEDDIEKREIQTKIKKVFSILPRKYELILRLKYIEGEDVQTIASKLSLNFKATESLLFRARKAFKKEFKSL